MATAGHKCKVRTSGTAVDLTDEPTRLLKNILQSPKMDTDSDLDGVVDEWTRTTDNANVTETFSLDTAEKAQKISVTDTAAEGPHYINVSQRISVDPSLVYSFAADLKVANAVGDFTARIVVTWLDGTQTTISHTFGAEYGNTTDYVRTKIENMTPPANAAYAEVKCEVKLLSVGDAGEAWFKNAQFEVGRAATGFTTKQIYQITDLNKQVLDPTASVTVSVNSSPVSSGYTVDRLFGKVVFDAPLQPEDVVTVSGKYLPMMDVVEAYQFTFTASRANLDRTRFQHTDIERALGLRDATGSVGIWHTSTKEFWDDLSQGKQIVIEMQVNNQVAARAWARPSTDETTAAVDGVVEESFEWEGTQDQDGRMVSFA